MDKDRYKKLKRKIKMEGVTMLTMKKKIYPVKNNYIEAKKEDVIKAIVALNKKHALAMKMLAE